MQFSINFQDQTMEGMRLSSIFDKTYLINNHWEEVIEWVGVVTEYRCSPFFIPKLQMTNL